jgi:hypothetical protein
VERHYTAGTMKRLAADYGAKGVTWLTINSTNYMDAAANRTFAESYGLSQRILVYQDGKVGHLYGAATTPHMFVIDAGGKIVYAGAIDDDPRGSAGASATNYVAAARRGARRQAGDDARDHALRLLGQVPEVAFPKPRGSASVGTKVRSCLAVHRHRCSRRGAARSAWESGSRALRRC